MQQQENTTRLTSVTGVEIPAIRRAPTSTNVTSPSTTATPPARNEGSVQEDPTAAEDTSHLTARQRKQTEKFKEMSKFFTDNYKGIDDIKITSSPTVLVHIGKTNTSAETRLVSLCGYPIADITARTLEKFCTIAKIPNYRNKNKTERCELIAHYKMNFNTMNATAGTSQDAEVEIRGTAKRM